MDSTDLSNLSHSLKESNKLHSKTFDRQTIEIEINCKKVDLFGVYSFNNMQTPLQST